MGLSSALSGRRLCPLSYSAVIAFGRIRLLSPLYSVQSRPKGVRLHSAVLGIGIWLHAAAFDGPGGHVICFPRVQSIEGRRCPPLNHHHFRGVSGLFTEARRSSLKALTPCNPSPSQNRGDQSPYCSPWLSLHDNMEICLSTRSE
jgi:hypothetical protein